MRLPTTLLRDTVSVETYGGDGAYGPVYEAATTVACMVDQTRRLVVGAMGESLVSELTLLVQSTDEDAFAAESRVTIGGRTTTVLTTSPKRVAGHTAFVEVACR